MAASERNKDVYKIFKHSAVKIIKVEKVDTQKISDLV